MQRSDSITIREYRPEDKKAVMHLIRLNTPAYFAEEEADDLSRYLDWEIELYYVLQEIKRNYRAEGFDMYRMQYEGILAPQIGPPHRAQPPPYLASRRGRSRTSTG